MFEHTVAKMGIDEDEKTPLAELRCSKVTPITQDVLQLLSLERDAVPTDCLELLDDFEVRVGFDAGNESAIVSVNPVEEPEIVEAEIEVDECASYPLTGG